MKFFAPVLALALAAVSLNSVHAVACNDVDVCPTGTNCQTGTITTPGGTGTIVKPDNLKCEEKHAALKSLTVYPTQGTIEVTFNTATPIAATSDKCDFTYSSIGAESTMQADVVATVTCVEVGAGSACSYKYKPEWDCVAGAATPAPSGTATSASPSPSGSAPAPSASATPAPSPTNSTKSGIASLTGASPASLAVALVALVGGVNFALPN